MRTMVIANPASCGGKYRKNIPDIQRMLKEEGISYRFFLSQYPRYAEELAKKAQQDGFKRVIACGGDGTINEVANGIIGTDITLGIIPMGKGGDLAHNLGIDNDISKAIENIGRGYQESIDIVRVNEDRYYLGVGGIGFDSEVNRLVNNRLRFLKGRFAYTIGALLKIPGFRYKRVKIHFEKGVFDGEILLAAFGNTRSYGGGMYITPNAQIDDGILDICLIKRINKLKLLYMFPRVFKGTHIGVSEVRSYRSRYLSVESDTPLDFYGDGEFICKTPFSLEVVPKALKVITPLGDET